MQTQTKMENLEAETVLDTTLQPEVLCDHSDVLKEQLKLAFNSEACKDTLTMCSVNMRETGKANAFALYNRHGKIQISDPILADPEYVCRFGEDPTKCVWREEIKIDDLLRDDSPKMQTLLYEQDESLGMLVPKTDVCACILGLPMGKLDYRGFSATDIRRPTLDIIEFFMQQELLHPGFVLGILTNDGTKSGLLMCKKSEKVEKIDRSVLDGIGSGELVSRDFVLGRMQASGIVYADIDLTCKKCPKNRNPERHYQQLEKQYVNRVEQAVEAIFDNPDAGQKVHD